MRVPRDGLIRTLRSTPGTSAALDTKGELRGYGRIRLGGGTWLGPFTVLGKPYRRVRGRPLRGAHATTSVGRRCDVGSFVCIGRGSRVGDDCDIDNYAVLEQDVRVGARSHVLYGAHISNWASIGSDCVIGGFVGEGVKVGARSRVFGYVIHAHLNPSVPWDSGQAASAVVGPDAFIGFGAIVTGGVRIGTRAYVCPSALVTRNVPPRTIVTGVNGHTPASEWKGRLSSSPFFSGAVG